MGPPHENSHAPRSHELTPCSPGLMVARQVPLQGGGLGRFVVSCVFPLACGVLATPRGLVLWLARRKLPISVVFDVV